MIVVQMRARFGNIKADPAARGRAATPDRASVSSDRRAQDRTDQVPVIWPSTCYGTSWRPTHSRAGGMARSPERSSAPAPSTCRNTSRPARLWSRWLPSPISASITRCGSSRRPPGRRRGVGIEPSSTISNSRNLGDRPEPDPPGSGTVADARHRDWHRQIRDRDSRYPTRPRHGMVAERLGSVLCLLSGKRH